MRIATRATSSRENEIVEDEKRARVRNALGLFLYSACGPTRSSAPVAALVAAAAEPAAWEPEAAAAEPEVPVVAAVAAAGPVAPVVAAVAVVPAAAAVAAVVVAAPVVPAAAVVVAAAPEEQA